MSTVISRSIISIFILAFSCFVMNAQIVTQTTPKIESKSFNRTVSKLINQSIPLIGVDELKEDQESYVLLDARELNEFKVSHLERAIHIGYDNWKPEVLESIDKDAPIVVYCSIGVRSEKIGEKLKEQGFTNVSNLYGSIFEWANRGYPLVDNAGYPTMKVHAYSWLWGRWMSNEDYEKVY